MRIGEWYKAHGEVVISAEGKGEAMIGPLPDGEFYVWLSHDPYTGHELEAPDLSSEIPDVTLPGDGDVMDVVDWFIDCVARSDEERTQILSRWEAGVQNGTAR